MPSITWYLRRLRAMDAREIALRVRRKGYERRDREVCFAGVRGKGMFVADPWPRLPDRDDIAPELRAVLIRDAEEIIAGSWRFFTAHDVQLNMPPQWDKDYLADVRCATDRIAFDLDHRNPAAGADIKCVWEPSRWQHLTRLAMAGWVEKDSAALETVTDVLDDWIEKNPPFKGWNWTSALESGLRLLQFAWIDALLDNAGMEDARLRRLRDAILPAHAHFTWRHRSFGSSANNHLIGELAGLAAAVARWPATERFCAPRKELLDALERETFAQFAPDGGNREQALNYQLFSLELLLHAFDALGATGNPARDQTLEHLRRAADFFVAVQSDGDHWDYGDSDSAFALPVFRRDTDLTAEWKRTLQGDPNTAPAYWLNGYCGKKSGIGGTPMLELDHRQDADATKGTHSGTGILPVGQIQHRQDAGATQAPGTVTTGPHPTDKPFRGLDPQAPVDIKRGANLPHWNQTDATYAVVFRLADSLPASVLAEWKAERSRLLGNTARTDASVDDERDHVERMFSGRVERFLDAGHGACWLRTSAIADIVAGALTHFDGIRYHLHAWCVMPNHVHVLVTPFNEYPLAGILHSWKSFTAKHANKQLARSGDFWQKESYDHLIRDEEDFRRQLRYIAQNPEKGGLGDQWRWVWVEGAAESGIGGTPMLELDHRRDADVTKGTGTHSGTGVPPVLDSDHRQDAGATIFPDSGYGVIHGSGMFLRLDASPLGYLATAAHGHCDALHLSAWVGGTAVLIDPGTGAYYGDVPLRERLASWSTHNGPHDSRWKTPMRGGPFLWSLHHATPELRTGGADGLIGSLEIDGGSIQRRVSVRDTGWTVIDTITPGSASGTLRWNWQFAPRFKLTATPCGCRFDGPAEGGVEVLARNARVHCTTDCAPCSPAFKKVVDSEVLRVESDPINEPCEITTTFLVSRPS